MNRLVRLALAAAALGIIACGPSSPPAAKVAPVGFPTIDGDKVMEHVKVLASDEFEGRAPGTRGEELTVRYLVDQFKQAGLKPGNPDGTYIQRVPMVAITPDPGAVLTLRKGAALQKLRFRDDVVAWSKRVTETVAMDRSDVVFVGYGVQAPEFGWDDYKGIDLKGKTMLVLVGDPPVPDPADPTRLDPKTFGGRAMTYYGRWTYKYEMGQKMGAASVLIVHETDPAGYPFSIVQGKSGEQSDLLAPDKNMSRVPIEGWISLDKTKALFGMAGQDFDALKRQALMREFKPLPLGVTASMTLRNKIRTFDSANVVGKLEGSDPKLRDEYVVYTAHWDAFGIGVPVNGKNIYYGAIDNATGTAGLVEIGRAFAKTQAPPRRSILLLAVTAEEQYLMGSTYYATNPLYPLAKTVAAINMDSLNVRGRTKDIRITGFGNSELDDYAKEVLAEQGRVIAPDPEPERGGFYRSDHFPFAKQGVPALASGGGRDYIGKPPGWGKEVNDAYTANDYHKPSDSIRPDWDMSGAVEDLQYYWMVGYRVAQAEKYPQWRPGTEFKATRDAQLKAAGVQGSQ